MTSNKGKRSEASNHFLFDHVKLGKFSSSQVRNRQSSLSMDSHTSGESGNGDGEELRSNQSEDEDDRESIDEDMYTTKAHRVAENDYSRTKSKGKSPSKQPPLSRRLSSGDGQLDSYITPGREGQDDHPSTKDLSDLSLNMRFKNSKTLKNRHVSRQSQRFRKNMDNSIWLLEDSGGEAPTTHPLAPQPEYSLAEMSTPRKGSSTSSSQNSPSDSESALHLQPASLDTFSTPPGAAIAKPKPKAPLAAAAAAKKRPATSSSSSSIGNLMKSIGVKGAAASSRKGAAAVSPRPPTTPRLQRTASAQPLAASPAPLSFSSPASSLGALASPRTTSNSSAFSSSPFIQKFDSNILRTHAPATPVQGTPRMQVVSPTQPASPSTSSSAIQNLLPQLEEDPATLGTGVTHAIFQALFGHQGGDYASNSSGASGEVAPAERQMTPVHIPRWDDSDEEEEEDEDEHCLGPDLSHCKDIDVVDEQWLTDLIKSRSNSRSGSLDLTHRDRTSPLQSDAAPVFSAGAFEQALKKNLSVSISPPSSPSSPRRSGARQQSALDFKSPDHAAAVITATAALPKVVATTDSMLQRYITPTLITQLVLQLPHDDERLTSPRLSVLKALFKNCPSLRSIIAHALVVAAHSRFLRCEESRLLARRMCTEVNEASLATECAHISGFEGKPKPNPFSTMGKGNINQKREENPGTLVRDHDSSLVELTLFILITECTPPSAVPTASTSASSSSVINPAAASILARGSFEVIVSIVTNVMRCYGSRLGKTSGSVEQPGITKGVFKIVDILMTNKVDCVSGKAAVTLLLRRLIQRWPKGNHPQEVAYLKLCAHILVHLRPAAVARPSQSVSQSQPPTIPEEGICLSHVLRQSARAKDTIGSPVQKTLRKLVECMSSSHFKVATQAIQIVMQLNILHPHFISNPHPWCRPPLVLAGTQVSPDGGEEPTTAVEALVEVLRDNRSHWHPQVRSASEEALDNLLDYL